MRARGMRAPLRGDSANVRLPDGGVVPIVWELRDSVPGLDGRCARLEHENRTGGVYQWLERAFETGGAGAVDVTVTFRVGLVGTSALQRRALAGIGAEAPWASGDARTFFQDVGPLGPLDHPAGTPQTFTLNRTVRPGAEGRVWVGVGYRSGWEVRHAICVDDIEVTIAQP